MNVKKKRKRNKLGAGLVTCVSSGDFFGEFFVGPRSKPPESVFSMAPSDVSVKIKMTFGKGKRTLTKNITLKGTASEIVAQLNKLKV